MAPPDIYADETVEAFLRKGHFEHAGVAFLSIADEEILPAEIPIISFGEIGNSLHVPVVGFHGVLLVLPTRIARTAKSQRVVPQRYLACANRMKKEGGARSPSFWTAYIPVSCLPVCSPRKHRGAMGCTPSAWKVLSQPCPLGTSRTPYRTSGLPAGAEPSFESKDIIASTIPNQLDTYENN